MFQQRQESRSNEVKQEDLWLKSKAVVPKFGEIIELYDDLCGEKKKTPTDSKVSLKGF